MMIPDKIQFVVHYVMVIGIENFVQARAQIRHPSYGNQSQSYGREIYYTTNLSRNDARESRTSTDLPISFKAPDVGSQNFWNYYQTPGSSNRRTFLGDLGYFSYGKTNPFPNFNSFFEFMNPFFEKGNVFKPMPQAVTKSVSEPYRYEYPYNFGQTTEKNFLPPPKPIRASIVKLEAITRPPGSFEYVNPSEELPYFSNFKPIPAVKPNSLYIDELGFRPTNNVNFKPEPEPGWNSKPKEFPTTHFINNISSTIYIPSSAEVHQQSIKVNPSTIQELLLNDGDGTKGKITPNEASGSNTLNSTDGLNEGSEKNYTAQHRAKELNVEGLKSGTISQNSTTSVEYKHSKPATEVSDDDGTTQTARPNRRGNSIKIVTELTLEGLSKNNKTANIPRYPKFINMSSLISYELNKIKRNKVPRPRSDTGEKEESSSHSLANRSFTHVNSGDGLSLDLKILKDTNWDGFATEVSPGRGFTETGTTEKDDNLGRPNGNTEIDLSYDLNKGNNSKSNHSEKSGDLHNNKTIIVETRVTQSITKVLPITNRRAYKKLRGTNRGSETLRNIINQISSETNNLGNDTTKTTDSSREIVAQLNEEKSNHSSDSAISYEPSNTPLNAELQSKSTITVGKNLNGSKENELTDNLGRFTPRSRNGINEHISKRPHISAEDDDGDASVNGTTTMEIKQNFDLENESYHQEKVDTGDTTAIPETPRSNNRNETENTELKTVRKRKPKRRQKLKRRRTGKRRKNKAVTTKESTSGSIISEMDSELPQWSENEARELHVAL